MASENEISIREFARRIHVSEGAVRKAIKDNKIVDGWDEKKSKILFIQAYAEYGKNKTAPKAGHGVSKQKVAERLSAFAGEEIIPGGDDQPAGIDPSLENLSYTELLEQINVYPAMSYNEAIRRNEILSIAKEKMKLEEMHGTLVKKADIEKQLFAIGNELKLMLQNIPSRCISLLRTAANDVEAGNILSKEINQVLESFTNNI